MYKSTDHNSAMTTRQTSPRPRNLAIDASPPAAVITYDTDIVNSTQLSRSSNQEQKFVFPTYRENLRGTWADRGTRQRRIKCSGRREQ
jgi:hypothetical protein